MQRSGILYRVEPRGDGWTVSFCGQSYGCFERRIDALRSAARDARRVHALGYDVVIEVTRPYRTAGRIGNALKRLGWSEPVHGIRMPEHGPGLPGP